MYAIAGVTGHTGSAAAQHLLDRAQPVRVIVRRQEQAASWAARGADVAVASLDDANALAGALSGTEAAYLLLPPKYTEPDLLVAQARTADAIAEAVRTSGLGHVVFLSSQGADRESGTGPVRALRYAEGQLTGTGVSLTILRAPYFLENWAGVFPIAREQGVLPTFIPVDRAIPTAVTRDIGRIAADALTWPPGGVRIVEIEGPERVSPRQVAQALSALLGRPVSPVEAPLDAVVPTFTALGVSENAALLFREMYEAFNEGRMAPLGPPAEQARGTTPLAEGVALLLG
jgi:NAD(P)H dehydrogenase (quinone)